MSKVFCYVPDICLQAQHEAAHQVRDALDAALAMGVEPVDLPRNTRALPVTLTQSQQHALAPLAERYAKVPGRIVGGLIYAAHLQKTKDGGGAAVLEPVEDGLRPGQVKVLREIAPLMHEGKVVFAECGTGTGKGRMLAHLAELALRMRDQGKTPPLPAGEAIKYPVKLVHLQKHVNEIAGIAQQRLEHKLKQGHSIKRAVIVAAPSIENIVHLVREWQAVGANLGQVQSYKAVLLLGRNQYISAAALEDHLQEANADEFPKIREWFKLGMPAGLTESTTAIRALHPEVRGLLADLEYLARQEIFDYRACVLTEDDSEEDQGQYLLQRKAAMENADLVFTSHAFLCQEGMNLGRAGNFDQLPRAETILIDEAHLLESAQAGMAAKSFSVQRLRTELNSTVWKSIRKHSQSQEAIASLSRLSALLKAVPDETWLPIQGDARPWLRASWDQACMEMGVLAEILKGMTKNADRKESKLKAEQIRTLRYAISTATALESVLKGWSGILNQSPKRGMISITVGPPSVGRYIAARWAATPSAVLMSGTLAHLGTQGASCRPLSVELCVPEARFAQSAPYHPQWLFSIPQVMLPSASCFHRLVPPNPDVGGEDAIKAWLGACAEVIVMAAREAQGGMLVLMTGYERTHKLAHILRAIPGLDDRVIEHTKGQTLGSLRMRFIEAARAGHRPIWLATGAAWTGLDLSDKALGEDQASDDRLLVDLVIPALPYGQEHTTTHAYRKMKNGFIAEIVVAQRRLRQGIGRLVRRPGVQDRRLWLLDGRLVHPGKSGHIADMRRVLTPYLKKTEFEIPS